MKPVAPSAPILLAVLLVIMSLAIGGSAMADTEPVADAEPQATTRRAPTMLVTGANRGIGLEFAKQFEAAGWNVIGTARQPDAADELRATGAEVMQLDVTDAKSVAALAKALVGRPLDLVINNAGIGNRGGSLADLDLARVERVFQVNTLGPMRVTQALLPNLRAGDRKLIVSISSRLASIEGNTRGGYYGYRESKTALNMFNRTLSAELKDEGFTCIVMSPGWVRTGLGGPRANLSPEESITGMRAVIDGLSPEDTGRFFGHDGVSISW